MVNRLIKEIIVTKEKEIIMEPEKKELSPEDKILQAIEGQKVLIEQRFTGVEGNLGTFEDRLKAVEAVQQARAVSLPGVDEGKEQFSFFKAINAILSNDWSEAGFEADVFKETRKKDMTSGTGSAGGYIVPTQYIAELIEMLRAKMVLAKMGATILNNLSGSPVEIPKQTGGATAYMVAENAAITASDLTLGQLSMTPKSVAAMVKISGRLLSMSNPSVEAMVRRDIVQAIGLKIDYLGLRGSGADGEPTGIANTVGINTVTGGTNGAALTLSLCEDLVNEVENDNGLEGSLGFVMHSKTKNKLKKERIPNFSGQLDGNYAIMPMSDTKLAELLGWAFATSNQIPTNLTKGNIDTCSEVYFGNWQDLIIGQWGGMEIMASKETSDAFAKNQTWVRIIQDFDIGVRNAVSFSLMSDALTV